jgi:hypothetical protein
MALVASLCLVGSAWAKEQADPYEAARDAEARLDYRHLITDATRALEMPQSHEHLVTLYRMLGTANGVLGHSEAAVDAFTKLLAIAPDFHLPRGTSPKISTPFKEAGGYWIDRPGGLRITPTLPHEIDGGKALPMPVKIDDPLNMTSTVRVSYRVQGEVEWKKLEAPMGPDVTLTLPPDQLPARASDYVLELYFTALSSTGGELRLAGDATHPLTVAVRAPQGVAVVSPGNPNLVTTTTSTPKEKKPLIKQWWLWTAVGAAVVVIAVGGGVGGYYSRPDTSHVGLTLTTRTGP